MIPKLGSVSALVILDNDGNRIFSKYYGAAFPSNKEAREFEEAIFKKTKETDYEIVALKGMTVVYKSSVDIMFYVVGEGDENELILAQALTTFFDTVSVILKKNVEKRAILDKMGLIMLAADDFIQEGVILECDSDAIVSRVCPKADQEGGVVGSLPITEQTVQQVLQSAREGFKWSLLR